MRAAICDPDSNRPWHRQIRGMQKLMRRGVAAGLWSDLIASVAVSRPPAFTEMYEIWLGKECPAQGVVGQSSACDFDIDSRAVR
jgi:hypothetical protein